MQKVIEKSQQLTALLIEYRESKIYETCIYHLVNDEGNKGMYFLYRIEDKKQLTYGNQSRIKSYINLRKIKETDIYNYTLNTL